VFPILVNTASGPRTTDPVLTRAARVFGASRAQWYRKVVLPSSVPFVATGLRTAIPASLIGLLVGEILGAPAGLGAMVALGANTFRAEESFAAILVLIILSVSLLRGFRALEERVAPWRKVGVR
jgi:NitT/TauT family transport system permease protein